MVRTLLDSDLRIYTGPTRYWRLSQSGRANGDSRSIGQRIPNCAAPGIGRFLIAYTLYSNGINTLFSFGGIYAASAFGLSLDEVLYFGIVLNVTAGLGAATFAWIDDLIGSKWTILIALCGLSSLGLALVLIQSQALFFVLGSVLGLFVGPAQAAGRSMMARLAPSGLETEAFGLYELSGKANSLRWAPCPGIHHLDVPVAARWHVDYPAVFCRRHVCPAATARASSIERLGILQLRS